ncbi:hypothetical protein M8494_15720 [Serratia ureilytica]
MAVAAQIKLLRYCSTQGGSACVMRRIARSPDFISYWQDLALYCTQQEGQVGVSSKKSFISAVVPQIRLPEAVLIFITSDLGGTLGASRDAGQRAVFRRPGAFATATLALTLFLLECRAADPV